MKSRNNVIKYNPKAPGIRYSKPIEAYRKHFAHLFKRIEVTGYYSIMVTTNQNTNEYVVCIEVKGGFDSNDLMRGVEVNRVLFDYIHKHYMNYKKTYKLALFIPKEKCWFLFDLSRRFREMASNDRIEKYIRLTLNNRKGFVLLEYAPEIDLIHFAN